MDILEVRMSLKQDQKDFPHIAQDIQVAINYEGMTREQMDDMDDNIDCFANEYEDKYIAGQQSHGGNMWEMGAYQVLRNAKDEVLDQWSYLMTLEKILGEIERIVNGIESDDVFPEHDVDGLLWEIGQILNRRKQD
jgi:hypothetical protein